VLFVRDPSNSGPPTDFYNSLLRYRNINQINGINLNFLVGNSNMADARSHEAETILA